HSPPSPPRPPLPPPACQLPCPSPTTGPAFPASVGVPVSTPWNSRNGCPSRTPLGPSRNSRMVSSCPPELTIREFRLGPRGVRLGQPLREFQGVLTGTPTDAGKAGPVVGDGHGSWQAGGGRGGRGGEGGEW